MIHEANSANTADDTMLLEPINRVIGELRVPGDKSISHRSALLSSLAHGESILKNFSSAQDCAATLACLQALGVEVVRSGSKVVITGTGLSGLQPPRQTLDARNSGTTMRLLAGILAGQPFATTITGDDSLRSRPMLRVAEPLRLMGAEVEVESSGGAPLRIKGRRPLQAIQYQVPIASAQIKSAVLLAGLFAEGTTMVAEPAPTRDHTERMLPEFGVQVSRSGHIHSIQGGLPLRACNLLIPGDISSAAFFVAAAVALPGSDLFIRDVGLNPTRTGFIAALRALGADIEVVDERLAGGEPLGTLHVRGQGMKQPQPLEVSGTMVSNLIDELPLLAFIAASLGGEMKLNDAKELRFKESDRIAATVENLSRMGARVEAQPEGWQLHRGGKLQGAKLSSFGDHRIAMACAIASLAAAGPSQIDGAQNSVTVSLPEFWNLLKGVAK